MSLPQRIQETGWEEQWDIQTIFCLYLKGEHVACVRKTLFRENYYSYSCPGMRFTSLRDAKDAVEHVLRERYAELGAKP